MRFDVITIFPEMFDAIRAQGITARAHARGLWRLHCWNPRDWAGNAYRSVDDRPYGGGPGMVMQAGPLARALHEIQRAQAGDTRGEAATLPASADREAASVPARDRAPVLHLSPRGRPLTHDRVVALAALPAITLLASRYEAVDQRFLDHHVDEEVSVGDFVVSGGELPAMLLIDAIVRLLPGALNDPESAEQESFATGLLDCPHYTRPEVFEGVQVPDVLLSGHHARISRWRRERALAETLRRRPDLLARARMSGLLDAADERFLSGLDLSQAP